MKYEVRLFHLYARDIFLLFHFGIYKEHKNGFIFHDITYTFNTE